MNQLLFEINQIHRERRNQDIRIPDYLLEEAGIPKGTRLEGYTDEDSGEFTVVKADIQQDIRDVPACILSVLAQNGICLAALDELIMQESIIYGK
jgi:bifunctional DNA-binding transcriptional regulator/antitoxin component of YhaV-PrlF toxin-antitoxin module